MLQGIDKNGEMRNIRVNEDGSLPMNLEDSEAIIKVEQTSDKEVTLYSRVLTIDTLGSGVILEADRVTNIMIANYSEEADITMTIDLEDEFDVGANLALEFPMNRAIQQIGLVSTAADTKIQLVVKGVE